ncbi:MAG TPA: hypothetical protein VJR58_25520 [Vineibacter sp.]|nr:hypothetical protein [Vineibacter sp.]
MIDLLNSIAAHDGGAGGTLDGNINGRLVSGISSDALYHAITRFEDWHFPGQCSGFVAPDGPLLKCLETMSARGTDTHALVACADTDSRLPR